MILEEFVVNVLVEEQESEAELSGRQSVSRWIAKLTSTVPIIFIGQYWVIELWSRVMNRLFESVDPMSVKEKAKRQVDELIDLSSRVCCRQYGVEVDFSVANHRQNLHDPSYPLSLVWKQVSHPRQRAFVQKTAHRWDTQKY